jgi:hypothetical protein
MESKPVFELHKMREGFIVTSNEQAKEGELGYINFQGGDVKIVGKYFADDWRKVIAQQDQIDFSLLIEEEQKEIGWFDIKKWADEEAMKRYKVKTYPIETYKEIINQRLGYYEGLQDGFLKSQELLSDRRFTLEDMLEFYYWLKKSYGPSKPLEEAQIVHRTTPDKIVEMFAQSLSQKSWKVEIQHVCEGVKKEGESCTLNNKRTYPNCGKIKILKLC